MKMEMWKTKWTNKPTEAKELDNHEKVLTHTVKDYYPNTHVLLDIMQATLSVTSCECERSISLLWHLKTALRVEVRSNNLALLKCYREVDSDPKEVL